MLRLIACVVLFATVATSRAQQPVPVAMPARPIPAVEHVVIISIDGLRPDCALRADMPVLRGMLKDGAFTFWAKTTAVAITLPSHVSMVTGVTPQKHGIHWNEELPLSAAYYPKVPTVMELAARVGYRTALVAGKRKFSTLDKPGTMTDAFLPPAEKGDNAMVLAAAVKIIEAHQPAVMFIHFPDADTVGHAKGWGSPEQIATLEATDGQLGEVLAALQRAGMRESTAIIVSADHGGAGLTHGADDERSRRIPWIITGPGVRKNFDLARIAALEVRTEDTAATTCWLLGLPLLPNLDGRPVLAAFATPQG
jgi:predicted AlkP superfamily pyrophosphatase or phosphodiesterase